MNFNVTGRKDEYLQNIHVIIQFSDPNEQEIACFLVNMPLVRTLRCADATGIMQSSKRC